MPEQPAPGEVTRVVQSLQSGERRDTDQLLALVYDELRRLARARLAGEANAGAGMTLQATALVHEAYLRLLGAAKEKTASNTAGGGTATGHEPDSHLNADADAELNSAGFVFENTTAPRPPSAGSARWENRGHFFAAAALAMRRILVERARYQKRLKHGGGKQRVDLDDQRDALAASQSDYDGTDLVALDDAIRKLEAIDQRKARVVSLRYFAGLTVQETAAAMDLSPATVKNEWAFARAWLHRELSGDNNAEAEDAEAVAAEAESAEADDGSDQNDDLEASG